MITRQDIPGLHVMVAHFLDNNPAEKTLVQLVLNRFSKLIPEDKKEEVTSWIHFMYENARNDKLIK